jgi:hypothetical protein
MMAAGLLKRCAKVGASKFGTLSSVLEIPRGEERGGGRNGQFGADFTHTKLIVAAPVEAKRVLSIDKVHALFNLQGMN